MRKPTIYNIRNGYEALARQNGSEAHFFDSATLRFFRERMSSFKVIKTDNPRVFGVRTKYKVHYFEAVGDGYPYCFYRHIQSNEPLPEVIP